MERKKTKKRKALLTTSSWTVISYMIMIPSQIQRISGIFESSRAYPTNSHHEQADISTSAITVERDTENRI